MPRYKVEGRLIKLEDLTLEQMQDLWHKFKNIQLRTSSPKQWARCTIAMYELETDLFLNQKRTKPR